MTEPTIETDAEYENSRREAEHVFFLESTDWLKLISEASNLLDPPKDIRVLVAEFTAGLRDETLKPPPIRHVSSGLVFTLAHICEKYGKAELIAYESMLNRRCVPPSQSVTELENHAKDTLSEIHEQKWNSNISRFTKVIGKSRISHHWKYVEEQILEFVRGDLHRLVWFERNQSTLSAEPVTEAGGEPKPVAANGKALKRVGKPGRPRGSAVNGERIYMLRGTSSQDGLASQCGLRIRTIQRAEAGGRLTGKTIKAIADGLTVITGRTVSVDELKT